MFFLLLKLFLWFLFSSIFSNNIIKCNLKNNILKKDDPVKDFVESSFHIHGIKQIRSLIKFELETFYFLKN